MELNWKEIEAERTVRSLSEQVRVTGEMPSPDGRVVSNVLASSAQVYIENASPSDGVIDLDGRIVVTMTALDPDGRPFSFESGASFSHRIETDEASIGMQAEITPRIQELNVSPSENGAKLDASIDLMVSVISCIPIRAIDGVSGLSDLEMKTREIRHMRKRSLGSAFVRMREELAADGIEDVVSADGIIAVRDVACDQGAATISGVISVSAVTIDQNAHMGQLVRQVPFREKINMDPCDGEVFCSAKIDSIALRALGEEFSLISMEAGVTFSLWSAEETMITIPSDAFSPSVGFDCLYDEMILRDTIGKISLQTNIKESIALPENAPELEALLFMSARPIVTDSVAENGELTVNGVLVTTSVYESTSGGIRYFSEDIPFSSVMEARGANSSAVRAECIVSASGIGDRSIQAQYSLIIEAELYKLEPVRVAVGLAEHELPPKSPGMIICLASEGEEVYDIAKRCQVSCESVRSLNPGLEEPFSEGERLMLLV